MPRRLLSQLSNCVGQSNRERSLAEAAPCRSRTVQRNGRAQGAQAQAAWRGCGLSASPCRTSGRTKRAGREPREGALAAPGAAGSRLQA